MGERMDKKIIGSVAAGCIGVAVTIVSLLPVGSPTAAQAAAQSAEATASFNSKLAGLALGMSIQQAEDVIKTRDLVNEPTPFYEELPDGSKGPLKGYVYYEKSGNVQYSVNVAFSRVSHKVMSVSYEVWPTPGAETADLLAAARAKYGPPHDVVIMDNRRSDPRVDHPYVWGSLNDRHLELSSTTGAWVLYLEDARAEKRDQAYVPPGQEHNVPKL
jgi:hypothetical protein